jgi:hypothetical protein
LALLGNRFHAVYCCTMKPRMKTLGGRALASVRTWAEAQVAG